VIFRRLHLALLLAVAGVAPALAAGPATVSGVVRDTAGAPQIGAVVQLLRPNLSVITSVYTNSKGRFAFSMVSPGHYSVKAINTAFLPSLRENVRVQANTVVNLTLNSLYEVMQWLPAQPRGADSQKDDWQWTLRSAANRPLLRWLEDGPLVVVSDGHSKPKLKARLVATGNAGTFGEDGERIGMEVEDTPSSSRELLARVDFSPASDSGMESMLGFRQELGFAGSVQSVAAVAIQPEIEGAGAEGLDEAAMRSWETINMGDEFQAEAGAEQVLARFSQASPNTVASILPFVSVGWRKGDSTISYRLATAVPGTQELNESQAGAWLPALSLSNGKLALEHGLHQEIGWERRTDDSGVSFALYSDSVENPAIEGLTRKATNGSEALVDGSSGLLRTAAPGYSGAGMVASVERRLPRGNHVRLSYANGGALVLAGSEHPTPLALIAAQARPRHTQMYAISLSGTLDGTGTRWRASYRWQPEDTMTRVAPYGVEAEAPYLNIRLRQPVYVGRDSARSVDAMIDLRNLLAQGERPFVLTDGSLLLFAQDQRGVTAGLAFTF
jgi:hypothetical protein